MAHEPEESLGFLLAAEEQMSAVLIYALRPKKGSASSFSVPAASRPRMAATSFANWSSGLSTSATPGGAASAYVPLRCRPRNGSEKAKLRVSTRLTCGL